MKMQIHRRFSRAVLGTAALLLCLAASGCDDTQPPVETSEPAAATELAQDAMSGDWAARKLTHRRMWLTREPQARKRLARELMAGAFHAQNRREVARAVRGAHLLDSAETIAQARTLVTHPSLPLVRRGNILQALARDVAAPHAPAEFAATAREMMIEAPNADHEQWGIGLRLLGRFAPGEAWPMVITALSGGKAQKRAAVAAMSEQRFEGSLSLLAKLTVDPDAYVRRKALKGLRAFPNAVAAEAIDRALASEHDNAVCSHAIEAAGKMSPHVGAELLLERLDATDGCGPMHRFAILAELRRMLRDVPQLARVRGALLGIVQQPREPGEAAYAAAAVGDVATAAKLAGEGTAEGLVLLTSRSLEEPQMRLAAIAALGELSQGYVRRDESVEIDDKVSARPPEAAPGSMDAVHRLEALLAAVDEEPETITAVIRALADHGALDAHNAFLLIPYTSKQEDPALRQLAIEQLAGKGQGYRAARRLSALLNDGDAAVVAAAKRGLARIEGSDRGDTPGDWTPLVERLRTAEQAAARQAEANNTIKQSDVDARERAAKAKAAKQQ